MSCKIHPSQSRWPRRLTARLLELRVRIPPEAWMSVCCECCVLQAKAFSMGQSFVQRSSTESGVIPKHQKWEGIGPLRLSNHEKKILPRNPLILIKVY
jgi:hypothetical protein